MYSSKEKKKEKKEKYVLACIIMIF